MGNQLQRVATAREPKGTGTRVSRARLPAVQGMGGPGETAHTGIHEIRRIQAAGMDKAEAAPATQAHSKREKGAFKGDLLQPAKVNQ